jgi:hypothetical protein
MTKTLDEIARERGLIKVPPVPTAEQDRLAAMHPEDRGDVAWMRGHPVTGTVTTGGSPAPDQLQRITGGRFRYGDSLDEGIEVSTGRRFTLEQIHDRLKYERSIQSVAGEGS